jgi:hypothetical protein
MLQNAIAAAAVALVASAIYAAARSRGRARPRDVSGAAGDSAIGPQPEGEELVAVIAAAIAAASGMEADAFRIVGLEPSRPAGAAPAFAGRTFRAGASGRVSGGLGAFASRGLNTPAWGHVDRFELGE